MIDDIPLKQVILYELAKTMFRGYCTRYQAQIDESKHKMEIANRKEARHRNRKYEVCVEY